MESSKKERQPAKHPYPPDSGSNQLFPVFLKLDQLNLLIVGGGYVGHEKLQAILNQAPYAKIKLVALEISVAIKSLCVNYSQVILLEKEYEISDLDGMDLVIAALNDRLLSERVGRDARELGKLVNIADQPEHCDFYLSSIVKKGNLKIAISTNGKSPTIAKRVKEMLNECLPEELDQLLDQMQQIRYKIKGDFTEKVKQLNEITKNLASEK